jgi:hypothetical protein
LRSPVQLPSHVAKVNMALDYESQKPELDTQLIDFIRIDLQLGRTFAEVAALAKESGHRDHYAQAKADVEKVVEAMRRFIDRVRDSRSKAELKHKLGELEQILSKL